MFRKDRKINGRHGGGVLIAVRDYITVSLRPIHPSDSEMLFIVFFILQSTITIGMFYRPPGSDTKPLKDLQTFIQGLDSTADLILVGDINLPEIQWSCNRALQQSHNHALLIDIIQDIFLTQLVSEPTRNHNILDLLITTSPDIIDRLVVGDCFSNHNSLSFEILR